MLPIILLSVLALVIVLVIVIALRPSSFMVRRSQVIAAPPARISALVEDFRRWAEWSPWEGLDPNTVRTFSAASSGVGATYHWKGDCRVGEGEMVFTEVRPGEHLGLDIAFIKPFAARNQITFDFASGDGGTTVTWTTSGRSNFIAKAMSLVFDCEKMIGGPFEQGLAKLKSISESAV